MAVEKKELFKLISDAFPDADIELKDLVGDQNHYGVIIKSDVFAGKSRIDQHKLVNKALKDILGDDLHALSIKTSLKD